MCRQPGCKKTSAYNVAGQAKAMFCGTHKANGMVNVIDKRKCQHEGCTKQPTFNFKGETKRLFCAVHKQDGMVDVIHKRCQHKGCTTLPSFARQGAQAAFCAVHKQEGMVDVKNKTCQHEGCTTIPYFAMEGAKAAFCAVHKQNGMVDVINKRCQHEGCTKQPTFAREGAKAAFCAAHKQNGMVDVVHKRCQSDWCSTFVQDKYDGYCLHCYMHLFPDQPVSRNYKTKEFAVVEFVKAHFPHFDWIADRRIDGGCSRRRPDLLLDLGYQVIIVEVDENQHADYDCSCENKRMQQLYEDVGYRSIVFLRFNPDEYDDVSSCWGINGHGICAVKKTKRNEWADRLNALKEQIAYWSEPANRIDKMVEVVQLYYDTMC